MKIVSVSTRENRHLIPVQGWDSVEKVLSIYANGYTSSARAAERVTADEIERSAGGMGAGLFALAGIEFSKNRTPLVTSLLSKAKEALKDRDSFRESWDYDGMGTPFFKASLEIDVLDRGQDMYAIGISAAYVGDKPEQGLAEHLGVPRTLFSSAVEVEAEPFPDNRFEFDFDPIMRRLDAVLDTAAITGEQVANSMMHLEDGESRPGLVLKEKDGFQIGIHPGRVECRFNYLSGSKQDTWTIKGSVMSGLLKRDYGSDDPEAKATPTMEIVVSSTQRNRWGGGMPIWQPDQQQKVSGIIEEIAATLR